VTKKSTVFWVVIPCSWLTAQRFEKILEKFADISEESAASISRVEEEAKQVTNRKHPASKLDA
jgi:hypothetical protein